MPMIRRMLSTSVAFAAVGLALAGCMASTAERSTGNDSAATAESPAPAATKEASEAPAAETSARDASKAKRDEQPSLHAEPLPPPRPAPTYGQPRDDMFFDHAGTNPFVAVEDDPLSTFAIDVDTGSYTVVRNYIAQGTLPPEDAVRVEEFVNYFEPDYPAPAEETFSIHVDGGPSPFGEGYELLRIGLKAKEIAEEERKPANLTFVIDVSGSMNRDNRLGLVKQSLHLLVDSLQPSDQLAIVAYGSEASVVLRPTSLEEEETIKEAIDGLSPGGSTNAEEGLRLGYKLAERQYDEGAINRVILCSDGVANVGETSAEGILETIEKYADERITLTTVGFGMGNYNDTMMEQLANQGDGVYAYVDSFTEARRLFVEQLGGTLQTVARDAKIQIEFDPEAVDRYRLLGYENRDLRDEEFRDDGADAGEVGAGHTVTALYEVKLTKPERRDSIGTARVRYVEEETKAVREWTVPLQSNGGCPTSCVSLRPSPNMPKFSAAAIGRRKARSTTCLRWPFRARPANAGSSSSRWSRIPQRCFDMPRRMSVPPEIDEGRLRV